MLPFDVIRHEKTPAGILREHVELDELKCQRRNADETDQYDSQPRPARMIDYPSQARRVSPRQARHQRAVARLSRRPYASRQHRHQGLRNKQRRQQCDDDRYGNVSKEHHDVILGADDDGRENDNRRCSACDHGEADFLHTVQRRSERVLLVLFPVPEDALGHDNGIVDKHPDSEHQPHHRQNIE